MKRYGLVDSIQQARDLTNDQYLMYSDLVAEFENQDLIMMNNAVALALGGGEKGGGPDGGTPEV